MNMLIKGCVVATAAVLPTFAFAVSANDIQVCMETVAQTQFPDSRVTFIAPEEPPVVVPLQLNHGTHHVAVSVTDANTGRVVATGTCAVRDAPRPSGHVIVTEVREQE